jgi:hypothetical protein
VLRIRENGRLLLVRFSQLSQAAQVFIHAQQDFRLSTRGRVAWFFRGCRAAATRVALSRGRRRRDPVWRPFPMWMRAPSFAGATPDGGLARMTGDKVGKSHQPRRAAVHHVFDGEVARAGL